MNTLTDLLLGVGQPRVSHFPDLCTLLYTYLSTLDYWTKIVYYLFTQTLPVAHTSALTPTYIKSQKLPNWPISKELGLGRMLLPHWKLLFFLNFRCVFSRSNTLLDISQEWLVRLMWNKKEMHWLDTGWTMRPWPLISPMTLTFDFLRSNFKIAVPQKKKANWFRYWTDCMDHTHNLDLVV